MPFWDSGGVLVVPLDAPRLAYSSHARPLAHPWHAGVGPAPTTRPGGPMVAHIGLRHCSLEGGGNHRVPALPLGQLLAGVSRRAHLGTLLVHPLAPLSQPGELLRARLAPGQRVRHRCPLCARAIPYSRESSVSAKTRLTPLVIYTIRWHISKKFTLPL
jgi:hypothetical protein